MVTYSNTSSDTSSSSGSWGGNGHWSYESTKRERPREQSKKPELEDEVLKIITNKYLVDHNFVWLMDYEKRIYDDKMVGILQKHHNLSPFVHDPINGNWKFGVPEEHSWLEVLITDCLEHHDGHIVRANIIKFALSCLVPDSNKKRLTIIVKKEMGLETEDVIDLARLANASKVWKPDQFKEIEDRICIAVK